MKNSPQKALPSEKPLATEFVPKHPPPAEVLAALGAKNTNELVDMLVTIALKQGVMESGVKLLNELKHATGAAQGRSCDFQPEGMSKLMLPALSVTLCWLAVALLLVAWAYALQYICTVACSHLGIPTCSNSANACTLSQLGI